MAKAKSLFEIIGKGVEDFDSIKRLDSDSRSIMPAPQRMFDPNDRAYKPFLSDRKAIHPFLLFLYVRLPGEAGCPRLDLRPFW